MKTSAFLLYLFDTLFLVSLNPCKAQWNFQPGGVTVTLNDVLMLDSSTVLAVGVGGTIIRTTDNGAHWTTMQSGTQADLQALAFRQQDGYAVGQGVVCHSTDGGVSWTSSMLTKSYVAVAYGGYVLDGPPIFMGSYDGYIRFSYDKGATWTEKKTGGGPIVSIASKIVVNSTLTVFAAQDSVFQTFNGLQWTTSRTGIDFVWDQLKAGDLRWPTQFLVGVGGNPGSVAVFLRKDPTDTLWYDLGPHSVPIPLSLNDVQAFLDSTLVYVCGSHGEFLKSTDYGQTWIENKLPTIQSLRSLSFYTHNNGFVVGDSGLIFHTEHGGAITAARNNNSIFPTRTFLTPVFPNPFNPTTQLEFYLDEDAFVTVKVYNVLGIEIECLLSDRRPVGQYRLTWNASRFPSGVYYCRLTTPRLTTTQRMALVK